MTLTGDAATEKIDFLADLKAGSGKWILNEWREIVSQLTEIESFQLGPRNH